MIDVICIVLAKDYSHEDWWWLENNNNYESTCYSVKEEELGEAWGEKHWLQWGCWWTLIFIEKIVINNFQQ